MIDTIDVTGTVWGVFAHRFAIETPGGKILADLGPDAASAIVLNVGDRVTISGERKPSEVKVSRLLTADGVRHDILRGGTNHKHRQADPAIALAAAERERFVVAGEPRRKPKHWEVAASRDGAGYELHIGLDGTIKKIKDRRLESAG